MEAAGVNGNSHLNDISSTNFLYPYKNPGAKPPERKDQIRVNRDFIADLKINKEKSTIGTILEGQINRRPAIFKIVSIGENETWYEGGLNGEYFLLHCKDKTYDGKYGTEDFRLTVDYNEPSKISEFINIKLLGKVFIPDYFTVKGYIGDKSIDITLPNIRIPADSKTKDLLTMLLEDNGLKAQTVNGEIKTIKFASSAIKNMKEKYKKRQAVIDNDLKPIVMQGISTASGLIVGSVVSALLFKFGLKR